MPTCFSFWILSSNSACDEVSSCNTKVTRINQESIAANNPVRPLDHRTLTRASSCSNPDSLCRSRTRTRTRIMNTSEHAWAKTEFWIDWRINHAYRMTRRGGGGCRRRERRRWRRGSRLGGHLRRIDWRSLGVVGPRHRILPVVCGG